MVKTETFIIGTVNFIKHYSDSGFKIKQVETGVIYNEANDVVPCKYTYEETGIPIVQEEIENVNQMSTGNE